jgi:hypothetical protein
MARARDTLHLLRGLTRRCMGKAPKNPIVSRALARQGIGTDTAIDSDMNKTTQSGMIQTVKKATVARQALDALVLVQGLPCTTIAGVARTSDTWQSALSEAREYETAMLLRNLIGVR